ncbi:MAG: DUF4294 domain-containing protein [Flavobacteriales bacterium]|nr:DUF4294 domain-containing protein [Flavobacteriales bacterium]
MKKHGLHKLSAICLFILFSVGFVSAQDTTQRKTRLVRYEVVDGDTFPVYAFDEFILKDLNDPEAYKKYLRLVRNVKKTLPYAKLAAFRLQMMEDNLNQLKSRKARKKYIKQTEKAVKEDFMNDLKKLSTTQGIILMKLVYRETGKSTYQILKDYRGSASVLFWQSMGAIYGTDIKLTYDPVEDYQIEHIIRSLEIEDN